MLNKKILIDLFLTFFKVGATTFGGGVAMLANIERELVDKKKWLTVDELYNYIAIAQCTPGIIMVNTATLLGAKKGGFLGSVISTIAVVLPSFLIITFLASFLTISDNNNVVLAKFLIGMRIAICATSIKSLIKLFSNTLKDFISVFFFALLIIFLSLQFFFSNFIKSNIILTYIFSNKSVIIILLGIIFGLLSSKISKIFL